MHFLLVSFSSQCPCQDVSCLSRSSLFENRTSSVGFHFLKMNEISCNQNVFVIFYIAGTSCADGWRDVRHLPYATPSSIYEPQHDKTNKMTCGPSEDSDQH